MSRLRRATCSGGDTDAPPRGGVPRGNPKLEMTMKIETLGEAAVTIVAKSAVTWMNANGMKPISDEAFFECVKSMTKIRLPEALADAREAFAANMDAIAIETFRVSMSLAGIEAAKECCTPNK